MALANFIFMGWETIVCEWKQRNWYWGCQCTVNKSSRQPWGYLHKSRYFFNTEKLTWLKMLVRAMEIEPSVRIKFVSFWRHLYNIYVMISSTKIVHHARPCARSILGRLSYTDVEFLLAKNLFLFMEHTHVQKLQKLAQAFPCNR